MVLKIPDASELTILGTLRAQWQGGTKLYLYSNNHVPLSTDTASDYTPVPWNGGGPIILDSWGSPFTNGSGRAEMDEVLRTFTQLGPPLDSLVYGYYITDLVGNLLWAESNGTPVRMDAVGKPYSVLPRITLSSEF